MVNEILYINPSHQHSNVGVAGYGTEAENAFYVAKKVVEILKSTGLFKGVHLGEFNLTLSNAIAEANKLGATLILDIHTDAGGGRGCTGLYKSTTGKSFITAVYNRVSAMTPTTDRGIARRTDLGILNQTTGVAGLIELLFHDNADDVAFFKAHKDDLARAVAHGICDYCKVEIPVKPVEVPKVETSYSIKQFVMDLQAECNGVGLRDIRDMKLTVDGIAGNHTLEALSKIVLKEDSHNYFVTLMQKRLGGLGTDGIFGAKTKAKVIEFQRSKNLKPDGIVRYGTWFWLTR